MLPRTLVSRKRLLERLTDSTTGPLTLITGPAGAGKTALTASWANEGPAPGPVVWLNVRDDDNAPGVFWSYVLGAFRFHRVPLPDGIGSPVLADDVDRSLLVRLSSAVAQLHRPVVLVLDGLERVTARDVASGLDFVLGHSGPQLRLVLISRVDPLLPLHRYRAEDRISEIRGAELAFTSHEAAKLLRRHGLSLSEESVGALTGRTEGWAAGLRLCALAMQRADDPDRFARSFTGSQHVVTDYLLAEVLDALPPATQNLLLRTSILERIHPQLANVLTGRDDAEWILAHLARANAFVEVTGDPPWCRCHPLFSSVLRAHLRSRLPGLEPRLHRLAARWLADNGRLTEGLEHATATGDWAYAATLLIDHLAVGRLLTGPDTHRLERLFSGMPTTFPGAAPALVAAACALARHNAPAGWAQLDRAQAHLGGAAAAPSLGTRLAHTLLLLLAGGEEHGSTACATAESLAHRTRDLMAEVAQPCLEQHPEIEALRRYGRTGALFEAGRLGEAHDALEHALAACTTEVTRTVRYECLGRLALIESVRGELRRAQAHAREGLEAAEEYGIPHHRRTGVCHLALAAVAFDRSDLQSARHHLDLAADVSGMAHDPVCAAETAVLRARLELAYGNIQAALAVVDTAGGAHAEQSALRLAETRSAIHLARGDPAAAIGALRDTGGMPAYAVSLAAAHLAAGDTERAARLLAGLGQFDRAGVTDHVRILLLRAQAAVLDKDFATAEGLLARALDAARPEQFRRPFTEAGPWLRHLLARRPDLGVTHSWLTERLADAGTPGSAGDDSLSVPAEALSPRERDVLRCAAHMMSTEEIAAELYVSVNTVKTHLKSIYRKLSVSRRSEAVRRARERKLL
ncbi:LuxR C-terminal-related transcriptional regulator [Streptomyces sannanensis]|uniref:LuxR C-terminal-related transcriptional regulator n=1 Tax=Streptomyces sannanensis TaxID=285536 RepID=UPI0031E6393B